MNAKVLISAQLPSRRVAWVDLVVAHRRLSGDWVTRADIIQECLDQFFEHGGFAATDTRPRQDPSVRKQYQLRLRYGTVQAIDAELCQSSVAETLGRRHVVDTALLAHLADTDVEPPIGMRDDHAADRGHLPVGRGEPMLAESKPETTRAEADTRRTTTTSSAAARVERTACLSAHLPKPVLAYADLVVAHRHLANERVSRTEVIEECLERFFEHGGMSATSTRPDPDPSQRHRYRMYLRFETVRAINTDIVNPRNANELLSAWHVVATAMLDHLADCDPGPPPGPMYF